MDATANLVSGSSNIDRFEIGLEHDIDEQYQYEPGEVLRGHVLLKLTGSIKVKAIQVQLKGEATVSWEDERSPQNYRAEETYIDVTQNLIETNGESIKLDKGKHRFPLEYHLPPNLPSSFIGKFGSITYVVKATLKEDKKFGLNTMITSEPFLVLRRLDLEREPELMQPQELKVQKRLWGALAFCLSGKVSATLNVNRSGHLPGEDIFMDAEIANSSPRIVKAVQAAVIMHSTFHARNNTRYNQQVVNKKRDEWEMTYGEGRRWKNVRLTIPPYIPESRLDGCDIIDIRYELVFKLEISGGNELKITMPVTVGTVQGGEPIDSKAAVSNSAWKGGMPDADKYIMAPKEGSTIEDEDGYSAIGLKSAGSEMSSALEEDDDFRRPMEPGETRNNPLFMQ